VYIKKQFHQIMDPYTNFFHMGTASFILHVVNMDMKPYKNMALCVGVRAQRGASCDVIRFRAAE
jgi:hypothetical protein